MILSKENVFVYKQAILLSVSIRQKSRFNPKFGVRFYHPEPLNPDRVIKLPRPYVTAINTLFPAVSFSQEFFFPEFLV